MSLRPKNTLLIYIDAALCAWTTPSSAHGTPILESRSGRSKPPKTRKEAPIQISGVPMQF